MSGVIVEKEEVKVEVEKPTKPVLRLKITVEKEGEESEVTEKSYEIEAYSKDVQPGNIYHFIAVEKPTPELRAILEQIGFKEALGKYYIYEQPTND